MRAAAARAAAARAAAGAALLAAVAAWAVLGPLDLARRGQAGSALLTLAATAVVTAAALCVLVTQARQRESAPIRVRVERRDDDRLSTGHNRRPS